MTRKEAKKHIKKLLRWYLKEEPMSETVYKREAVNMALEALSAEPCEDAISREAVLNTLESMDNALDENRTVESYKDLLKECFKELSPMEPQGFEEYLNQYLGENDLKIIGNDVWEETKAKAEQTEWISVKDRLPTESDEYYVSIRYECENKTTFDNVTTSYFWAKEKMWKGSERMIGKILAWQPITEPSPYKGE